MLYLDIEQGSEAWRQIRLGKVTGSRVADVCAKLKSGGWGASRANYLAELVLERLTGKPTEGYVSQDMLIGTQREPDARAEYELRYRCDVQQIGFVDHPTIPMSGASADGFVGENGLVEFKAPKPATHLSYLRAGVVPSDYVPQIMWNFACNPDRTFCDFCSYNPEFPAQMMLFTVRINRDDKKIAEYEDHVRKFLAEVDQEVENLRKIYIERKSPALSQLKASAELLGVSG